MQRRTFLASALALRGSRAAVKLDLAAVERVRVLKAADRYLKEAPVTVTASASPRSAGGKHDFFSEGDYGWPDPANPKGPYIQCGMTNPDNFVEHRRAMVRLSLIVPALAAAYKKNDCSLTVAAPISNAPPINQSHEREGVVFVMNLF